MIASLFFSEIDFILIKWQQFSYTFIDIPCNKKTWYEVKCKNEF